MSDYEVAAKKLLSVCQRLENWFKGEKLYETTTTRSNDEDSIIFRWAYRDGKFTYYDEKTQAWKKVVNIHMPLIMAKFISIAPVLHEEARNKKDSIAEVLDDAANAGEEYLQVLSGFEKKLEVIETSVQ